MTAKEKANQIRQEWRKDRARDIIREQILDDRRLAGLDPSGNEVTVDECPDWIPTDDLD